MKLCISVTGSAQPELDPSALMETSVRLNDADNETCLALTDADFYTFDASSSRWFPKPKNKCWLPGLVIRKSVPSTTKTSFTVTITGHHLTCSTSHFKVAMRQTKRPACKLAGEYRICKWTGAVQSGGLTTCVAACRCEGDDCRHVTIHIPHVNEEWELCEIDIE